MGGQQSVTLKEKPQQFVTQAHKDWVKQMEDLYSSEPTTTKTIILPPHVELDDPRLNQGVVVSERKYTLEDESEWPEDHAFECDIHGQLLPPCWGKPAVPAHFAVYPNKYFPELNCGYCELHNSSHHQDMATSGQVNFSAKRTQ